MLAVSVGKVIVLSTSVEAVRKKEPWQKGRKRQDGFLVPSKSGFYILAFKLYLKCRRNTYLNMPIYIVKSKI